MQYFFFVHAGARIGTLKGNTFTPTQHMYWYLSDTSELPEIVLNTNEWTNIQERKDVSRTETDGWYAIRYGQGTIGIGIIGK